MYHRALEEISSGILTNVFWKEECAVALGYHPSTVLDFLISHSHGTGCASPLHSSQLSPVISSSSAVLLVQLITWVAAVSELQGLCMSRLYPHWNLFTHSCTRGGTASWHLWYSSAYEAYQHWIGAERYSGRPDLWSLVSELSQIW